MTFLQARNVTKKFGEKIAVNQINFNVEQGQFVAFLGPNGAGKSTSIEMLTGLTTPTHGTIELSGMKVSDKQYRTKIGVVFQDSVLDRKLTVKDNLLNRAQLYHNFDQTYFIELVEKFEIGLIMNQKYGVLSGGQRRRVDITRALVHRPKLLFLDEPSTGLDIQTRNKIWTVLNEIRQNTKLTIILTTHYLEEAEFADYVYVIDHGEIIAHNSLAGLKQQYAQDVLTLNLNQNSSTQEVMGFQRVQNKIEVVPNSTNQAIQIVNQLKDEIDSFEMRQGTMDDIFIALTGKEIR